jgi:hypothetical protein
VVRELLSTRTPHLTGRRWRRQKEGLIMLWAILIAGTYVAGIYVIRLVWWQE